MGQEKGNATDSCLRYCWYLCPCRGVVVDVTTLKMARKPVKLQKESPAGCAGEGKQSRGNYEKRKGRFKDQPTTAFCEEESVTSR